jgi:sulfide dehydrogenase [flavocytochrome c] flavoprotein subunit
VRLGGGATLSHDRPVVKVGSTIRAGAIERYDEAAMQVMPHAWKACGQTLTLRRQLESMPDGGLFAMAAPPDPFPCPPAPYERVSLIAAYFKQYKPRVEDHGARRQGYVCRAGFIPGCVLWVTPRDRPLRVPGA